MALVLRDFFRFGFGGGPSAFLRAIGRRPFQDPLLMPGLTPFARVDPPPGSKQTGGPSQVRRTVAPKKNHSSDSAALLILGSLIACPCLSY